MTATQEMYRRAEKNSMELVQQFDEAVRNYKLLIKAQEGVFNTDGTTIQNRIKLNLGYADALKIFAENIASIEKQVREQTAIMAACYEIENR